METGNRGSDFFQNESIAITILTNRHTQTASAERHKIYTRYCFHTHRLITFPHVTFRLETLRLGWLRQNADGHTAAVG